MHLQVSEQIGQFLIWLSTPEKIFRDAYSYLVILMVGLPFTILYNFCFGVLMAFGDSKNASVFMTVSTVVNIGLDLMCILVFHMGVAGAAFATVISQGMAGIASARYVYKNYSILYEKKEDAGVSRKIIANIARRCLPMGIQYSITAIGALVLQQSLNHLGTEAIAAYSAGQKIKSVLLCPLSALGTALSSFVGQNYGAGKGERMKEGVKDTVWIGIVYSIVMIGIIWLIKEPIAFLFVSAKEKKVCVYIQMFTMYSAWFNVLLVILFSFRYCVQGMGYGRYALLSSLAEMLGRIVSGLWLVPAFGFAAVILSEGLTFLAGIFVIVPIGVRLINKQLECRRF
ncbi:MAG: MATE family efflux transporter [Lachnospiraceae bacterium]